MNEDKIDDNSFVELADSIIEELKEEDSKDKEAFELYAKRLRLRIHYHMHDYPLRFVSGYHCLVDEIAKSA